MPPKMTAAANSILDVLSHLRINFKSDIATHAYGDEEVYRAELFSLDQMNRHGREIARSHKLRSGSGPDQLLKRLHDNETVLLKVRGLLVENIRAGKTVTPGAEWLLDNFYLIEEQVVLARKHLPKGYSQALPSLAEGASAGMPRVYDIILEIIAHSDGRVDGKGLTSFIEAYQTHMVLTLGELWAIPIMLRLAVIENLRRVSGKIALDMVDNNLAGYWANRMADTIKEEPGDLVLTIADMARSRPVLSTPFVSGFSRRLQGKGPAFALPLSWMEQQLAALGLTGTELVQQESQKQAADQVSVRNSIGTLRVIGATDWPEFVETLSRVEQILREDFTGTYPLMDFSTRDRYRHVVEDIAKASLLAETEVARKAIELARGNNDFHHTSARQEHVGYYLIGEGRKLTEQALSRRHTLGQRIRGAAGRMPVAIYLSSITIIALLAAAGMSYLAYKHGTERWLLLSLLFLLALSATAQLAVSLVNWVATIWVKPGFLPRMDFSKGIPAEFRTLVIIPTMLSSRSYIEFLVEALEIRFLANREANVHYGLLTDFTDADSEVAPGDDELVQFAGSCIAALNLKYSQSEGDIFFLFHRPRKWNEGEQKWMGYERKRGKLSALNALLRGHGHDVFSAITGRYEILTRVKYVITLDSDTQLPREAVWKMIATMAHPLNHAIYNAQKKRVVEGYGILQPRVASSIPEGLPTPYLRMQGDISGIDPYTRASSDVYQDLFGEGSFIGKGIYDVDVFEQALDGVFPDNRILSHDLLEGCYARSGLLSDVLLYEENPAQYAAEVKRHHRWIRGDWQIAAWMLPFVTAANGRLIKNRLSTLSRWKIFDNVRRSLLPVSLLLLLLMGWTILPFPWFWTFAVTSILLMPAVAAAVWHLINKPKELSLQAHVSEVGISLRDTFLRFLFGLAVLPYEAYKYTDAIARTNWRMGISRKKLLQWTPSASALNHMRGDVASVYGSMFIGPVLAIACAVALLYMNSLALLVAAPFFILWLLGPAIVRRISIPERESDKELPAEQTLFLNKTARKTWLYFEQFVNETENWLPPDNYQEHPVAVVAHRTSPTNMGLALLANLAAYDFGYITARTLSERCSNTLQSMLKLERFKGHFYNWYDTLTLQPLHPRYVSTVDSGNLVGHLLTLRQGLMALSDKPVFCQQIIEGLKTTAEIIVDAAEGTSAEITETILASLNAAGTDPASLVQVSKRLHELTALAVELQESQQDHETLLYEWGTRFTAQLRSVTEDLAMLLPWQELLPIPDSFPELGILDDIPSLQGISEMPHLLLPLIAQYEQAETSPELLSWFTRLRATLVTGSSVARDGLLQLKNLAEKCEELSDVDYDFLLDKSTNLLRIGYNIEEGRKDVSSYDLLASEARLCIFIAIAQGKLPQESWFALGRLLTNPGGDPILLSWSGSMFEYLMPQLVMPAYENTLLYQTNKASVKRQIDYASARGIPWGISESAYNTVDANFNYQYRAFGVPGLGLKRGLEEDTVIAPYAAMLALMVMPAKAASNLQRMAKEGFEGRYGFYEAIDYTASRVPRGEPYSIIRSYMVHHQGMGLLSLAYQLLNKPMQQRFTADLSIRATLLLLQERIPRATLFQAHTADQIESQTEPANARVRTISTANTLMPEVHLLSNGRYQVMVSNSGAGYSRWKDIAISRWREDATKDDHGTFCYIKDVSTGKVWSNTYQPTLLPAEHYEAVFSQGHAEFRRMDDGIETKTEIVVSPEDDGEMRRLRITNKTQSVKVLEVTSYTEVVLASQAADESHPALSNLFVQTEIIPEYSTVLCTRRARSTSELPPWMFHHMDVHGTDAEAASYETDRMRFIGRGRTLAYPQAMDKEQLSGSQGSVLDPVMSIRYRISIPPNQTAIIDLIYGVSETREGCESLMHKYRDQHLKKRAFELSWTHSQVLLRQINATEADAQLYNRLAAAVIYSNTALRADQAVIQSNFRGQSGLWSHSVSGDLPIVLLHIHNQESVELVRQLIKAHAYWQLKGLAVDLVIWNEDHGSYRQELQEQILGMITAEAAGLHVQNKPGDIFVKSVDQVSHEDRVLFESVARIIIHDDRGSLAEQLDRYNPGKAFPARLEVKQLPAVERSLVPALPKDLLFHNGIGGFTPDGKEYKILIDKTETTPAPWVNVIASPNFGTVISESGSAYTWALNAHEYRITPWSNDPVSDNGGEAFYLRDEETGSFWSPCPYPASGSNPYVITHGFGYSRFEYGEHGLSSEMTVFVDKEQPVKFIVLKIKNGSGRLCRLSATGFLETVLGDVRSKTNMHIVAEHHADSGALLLRNRYNTAFSERVSFFKADGAALSFTTDRSEFIGRNRSLNDPTAMGRKKLSGTSGAGMDPCAALQVKFELQNGGEKEIIFQIGSGENIGEALTLIQQFAGAESVKASMHQVTEYWADALNAVQITTPDAALNILANGWLTYQTLACRIFARSGFYQSGGAFGFRDQLQDVLALMHTKPELARHQILLNASRQFAEGDVQHWWHPPEGRGVRTRCSDDMLWLPYVVSRYVDVTGDAEILNEQVGFLESRLLHAEEESLYELPGSGKLSGTLHEHCLRTITHSLRFGSHGLPLIGSGDWNDGMDQVGHMGKGESVWLGFFLYDVLLRFAETAVGYGDASFAETCRREATTLGANIETGGWDGEWYMRAFYDDGTPLGSKENEECRIDAIAQSWSVLSGAGDKKRSETAMASLDKFLVRRDLKLIQLLTPAFDRSPLNPGYIKGYVPGVRENGGQYSHAAIWALMAFAGLGQRSKVWELFSMINPLNHSSDAPGRNVYKVEPYVMAADVYANESHKGRGGWTWYTGSAGWMYQFIIGSLLGMELRTNRLKFHPCFPLDWPSVSISYRFGSSTYHITVFQQSDILTSRWEMGSKQGSGNEIEIVDDGLEHEIKVFVAISE